MPDRPNLSFSICSIGLSVLVSAVFPGSMHIAGREAVMVHEQPRLYKGQRTALFAVAQTAPVRIPPPAQRSSSSGYSTQPAYYASKASGCAYTYLPVSR